jgi:phosphoenolpyruvate phosphomutase
LKAIIIAAGMGRRMKELGLDMPKCLLEFNGKRILDIQLEAFKANGIDDVSIVVGYKKEKINYPGLKYYFNDRYEHNNILHSLMYAENEMDSDFMASYSDIIYDKEVIRRLNESRGDISIVVDTDWMKYYAGRNDHPLEEAENVVFNEDDKVVNIGKMLPDKAKANAEFLGIVKCSVRGAKIFREHFKTLKEQYDGKPFQKAEVFEKAYITDMVQDLVDNDIDVECVKIKGGWREIDTVEDYERAERELEI